MKHQLTLRYLDKDFSIVYCNVVFFHAASQTDEVMFCLFYRARSMGTYLSIQLFVESSWKTFLSPARLS